MNVSSFSRVLMTFAVVSALGIVLQVDAAGGGPDQKADALPSDPATLATIKAAIALARKGELAQASDVKESIERSRRPQSGRVGNSAQQERSTSNAMLPSSPTIRAGRISVCCADARRRRSGRNGSIPRPCARILARTSRSPPRASLRWLARCCWKATAPTRRISFARLGVTTTSPATSKPKFWMFSET